MHMKMSMHINENIPVTITHVKENRKNIDKRGKREFCVDTTIMLDILISLCNEESLRSSNKLANFFKD